MEAFSEILSDFIVYFDNFLLKIGISPSSAVVGGALGSRKAFWRYLFKIVTVLFFFQKFYTLYRYLKKKRFRRFIYRSATYFTVMILIFGIIIVLFGGCSSYSSLNHQQDSFNNIETFTITPDSNLTSVRTSELEMIGDHVLNLEEVVRNIKIFDVRKHVNATLLKQNKEGKDLNIKDIKSKTRLFSINNISADGVKIFNSCRRNKHLISGMMKLIRYEHIYLMSPKNPERNKYVVSIDNFNSVDTWLSRSLFRVSSLGGVVYIRGKTAIPLPYLFSYIEYLNHYQKGRWPKVNSLNWKNMFVHYIHYANNVGLWFFGNKSKKFFKSPKIDLIVSGIGCDSKSVCYDLPDSEVEEKVFTYLSKHGRLTDKELVLPKSSLYLVNLLIKERRCKYNKLRAIRENMLLGIIPNSNDADILLHR